MPTRMERYQEALEVVTRLLHSDEPVDFTGKHYQLKDALLTPRPQRAGGPPILIGGNGPKRTLPLAARYADIWNAVYATPEKYHELSSQLDELLLKAGRQPSDVKRTLMLSLSFARTTEQFARKYSHLLERSSAGSNGSVEQAVKALQAQYGLLAGTPQMLIEQIKAYANVGVEEFMLQLFDMDDIEGLEGFAETVIPYV